MREDYRCDYFIGLEDNFPEEAVQEYTNRMLSLDEMRELYRKKWEGTKTPHNIGLKKDETTGLYYTKYDFTVSYHDLLTNHILAELLFANRDQVDWALVTNGYDYRIIKKIDQILSTPLVWIPVSDIEMEYVVAGVDNVAAEIYPPERFNFQDRRYWFLGEMREQGLLWFADKLPTRNDIYDADGYGRYPDTLVLWDRLLCAGYYDLFTPMETIVEKLGCAKAVRLIDRLRDEWDSLVALDFFRDCKIKDYEQDRLYRELTKGIEPHVQSWRKKAAVEEHITTSSKQKETIAYPFIINAAQSQKIIDIISSFLKGKSSPRDVMMPIRAAMEAGLIRRPTFGELQKAFPTYCPAHKSSVSFYTNMTEQPYVEGAYHRMVEELKELT